MANQVTISSQIAPSCPAAAMFEAIRETGSVFAGGQNGPFGYFFYASLGVNPHFAG